MMKHQSMNKLENVRCESHLALLFSRSSTDQSAISKMEEAGLSPAERANEKGKNEKD